MSDPTPPEVKNQAWVQSPLDRFILASSKPKELAPAAAGGQADAAPPGDLRPDRPAADPRGSRRVPGGRLAATPSPRSSIGCWPRPHYGERWGRHWLDVARYADSNGMDENVAHGNAWRYRDYVVAAFNRDKPYDQFVREQIAGDLLARPTTTPRLRRATDRHRLPGPRAEGAGRARRGEDGDGHRRRAGRYRGPGVPGADARLRPLPRSQVRPDPDGRLLRRWPGSSRARGRWRLFKKVARWHENPLPTCRPTPLGGRPHAKGRTTRRSRSRTSSTRPTPTQVQARSRATASTRRNSNRSTPPKHQTELKQLRAELADSEKQRTAVAVGDGRGEGTVAMTCAIHIRGSHLTAGRRRCRDDSPVVCTRTGTALRDRPERPARAGPVADRRPTIP